MSRDFSRNSEILSIREKAKKVSDATYDVINKLKGTSVKTTKYGELNIKQREQNFNGSDVILTSNKGLIPTDKFLKLPEIINLVREEIIATEPDQMIAQYLLNYIEEFGPILND